MPAEPTSDELIAMLRHPHEWRKRLRLRTGSGIGLLDEIADPWQREDFAALDRAWQRVVGIPVEGGKSRAYYERGRGCSKTQDLMIQAVWPILASPVRIKGIAAAADLDQVKFGRYSVEMLLDVNPWLRKILTLQENKLINERSGSELEYISSSHSTSWGHLVDFVIGDEITNWSRRELWDSLFSAILKKPHCVMAIGSNAGVGLGSHWTWDVREFCRNDVDWHFHSLPGPVASWQSPDLLAQQRRGLLPDVYDRVIGNRWQVAYGKGLDSDDLNAAPKDLLNIFEEGVSGYCFVCGCDLGWSKDSSAITVLAANMRTGRVRTVGSLVWTPTPGKPVVLSEVKDALAQVTADFNVAKILIDPREAVQMITELQLSGIPIEPYSHTTDHDHRTAETVWRFFRERIVDLDIKEHRLFADLQKLSIDERPNGTLKISFPRTSDGHCDLGMSFCFALAAADEVLATYEPVPEYKIPELPVWFRPTKW
jgi:hypothetical protein